jgi:hypothetical protein
MQDKKQNTQPIFNRQDFVPITEYRILLVKYSNLLEQVTGGCNPSKKTTTQPKGLVVKMFP